ncbi:MAG TPA: M3 family metallopeptidase [Kofleriaceae bacterium]
MKSTIGILLLAACGGGHSPAPATTPEPAPAAGPAIAATGPVAPPPAVLAPKPADELAESCKKLLAGAHDQQEAIAAEKGAHTRANTLERFNEIQRLINNAAERAGLMHEVHPDAAVREAARACERDASSFATQLFLDKRMYDALAAVDVSKEDADTQRFVMTTLRDYKREGVDKDEATRKRLAAIDDEMTKLGQEFGKGVAEDTREIVVTDPKRLDGLPPDWIAAHKPDAKGGVHITTDYPDYIPFETYAADDALRKDLYVQFRLRGSAHNEATMQQLLTVRAEKAKLLGFQDWADYQSDDKMLRGGKNAQAFIDRVTRLAKPRAARDYAELLAALRKHDPKAKAVADWQKAWLENQVKHDKYAVDAQEVRTYFAYDKVLAGLLQITGQIYDIQYQPVPDAPRWHPDVQVFDVMRGTEKLGRIYLDMHPRADKYKHAAQFPIQDGEPGVQLPEGALVCNLPQPSGSDPGLMDHGDVVTMFHEFGHLMHHVLGGKHHWVRQSGVATEADFVEAPSQMFEEWGKSYETLSKFATNAAGQTIPKDLVEKLRKAETFGLGTQTVQQMFYAALSLGFHQADPAKLDQAAFVKAMQTKYTPFAYVEGTKLHTSFDHLVGYSSMYYTYMWSLVIAKDLLTPFAKPGLLATSVTYRYRDTILVPGGTKPAAELVKDFLGRPYNFKAFEAYLAK